LAEGNEIQGVGCT